MGWRPIEAAGATYCVAYWRSWAMVCQTYGSRVRRKYDEMHIIGDFMWGDVSAAALAAAINNYSINGIIMLSYMSRREACGEARGGCSRELEGMKSSSPACRVVTWYFNALLPFHSPSSPLSSRQLMSIIMSLLTYPLLMRRTALAIEDGMKYVTAEVNV